MPSEAANPFSPEAFFRRAAGRLAHEPPVTGSHGLGDHVLNPHMVTPNAALRDAAVLIPVVAREGEATMLLTKRTPHLKAHAGQIAFPGGKIEDSDRDAAAAAIREAEEEIGLDPAKVATIGYLPPYVTGTFFRIVPVVGRVDPNHRLTINRDEVDDAFEVPLSFLMTPENHRHGSRTFSGGTHRFYEMPFGERYIWGITAGIIRALYERVFG